MNIYDPTMWDNLDGKLRDLLVKKDPTREDNFNYPIDKISRHFSSIHYTRVLPNDETQDRKWLVYSKE